MRDKNYYILLGGPENLDFFEHNEDYVLEQWFWTAPKDAKEYEVAFVYLTAPVSRIVGKVMFVGEPFFNVNMFEHLKTKNKWMAEISCVGFFKQVEALTMRGLRGLFPDWPWLGYPRGLTKIPADVIGPFLELTNKHLVEPS